MRQHFTLLATVIIVNIVACHLVVRRIATSLLLLLGNRPSNRSLPEGTAPRLCTNRLTCAPSTSTAAFTLAALPPTSQLVCETKDALFVNNGFLLVDRVPRLGSVFERNGVSSTATAKVHHRALVPFAVVKVDGDTPPDQAVLFVVLFFVLLFFLFFLFFLFYPPVCCFFVFHHPPL
jgi:hypothetical protein